MAAVRIARFARAGERGRPIPMPKRPRLAVAGAPSLAAKRAKQLRQYHPAALTENPAGWLRHVQIEHIRVKTVHPNLVDRRGDGILGKHVVPSMEHVQRAFHVWIGRVKAVEKWHQV